MQNRLFRTLGRLGDARRRRAARGAAPISASRARRCPPTQLARARTLFARALETPGGLQIQTIHAFCEALLRRFPLEAGVAPQFARARGPPGPRAARGGAGRAGATRDPDCSPGWRGISRATTRTRSCRRSPTTAPPSPGRSTRRGLAAALGVEPAADAGGAGREVLTADDEALLARARRRSAPPAASRTAKAPEALARRWPTTDPEARLELLEEALLTTEPAADALRRQDRQLPDQGPARGAHPALDRRGSTR